jgi:F-type H+-transporting ATPase subunit b
MMQIDWWTLTLQVVNFLILVWLLWRFLYQPVKEVIEKRKKLAEQAFADVDRQKSETEAARQRFEEGRAGLAQERQDMLKEVHEELEVERRNVLGEARHEADELLEAARDSIDEEREAALRDVREQTAALAVELASGLLRKAESSAPAGVFLEQLERQLKELPTDERRRLQKDLAAKSARLMVVTAVPLTAQERDHWTDRFSAYLSQRNKTEFETDPEILGGAELRFPHAVLRFTWVDQLHKAGELLRRDEAASR